MLRSSRCNFGTTSAVHSILLKYFNMGIPSDKLSEGLAIRSPSGVPNVPIPSFQQRSTNLHI